MIKRRASFLLLAFMLLTNSFCFSQSGKVPPFQVVQANGKIFKAQELPMGKPIIIIYFLPDCDHCQDLTKQITRKITDFRKASIAMITYESVTKVQKFVTDYNLKKYPNIWVGTEGSVLFVRNYYKVEQMPFMALYTKNGNLVRIYKDEKLLHNLTLDLKTL